MGRWRKVARVMPRHNNSRYWRKRATFWFQRFQSASYAIEDLNAECERLNAQVATLDEAIELLLQSNALNHFTDLHEYWRLEMESRAAGFATVREWIDALRIENHRLSSERQRSGTSSSNVSVSLTVDASKLIDALQRFDEKYSKRG